MQLAVLEHGVGGLASSTYKKVKEKSTLNLKDFIHCLGDLCAKALLARRPHVCLSDYVSECPFSPFGTDLPSGLRSSVGSDSGAPYPSLSEALLQ